MKSLSLLLLVLFPGLVFACSCTNDHQPLEEVFCRADTSGGVVMIITLRNHLGGNTAEVSVDEVLIGAFLQPTLTVSAYHSCAYYIDSAPVGQRYLYFYSPSYMTKGEGDLSTCGDNANIYRLDNSGEQVEYGYTTRRSGDRNAGLRFREFRNLLGVDCSTDGKSAEPLPNPLANLRIAGNAGDGQIRLMTIRDSLPTLTRLEYYSTDGRLLAELSLKEYTADSYIDLTYLPRGFAYLQITDGIYRKTLPYVKLR